MMEKVKIDTGWVSGMVADEAGRKVRIYRGIPYAAPPVGGLRWRSPQPAASWTGIRECQTYSKAPPQSWTPLPDAFPTDDPRHTQRMMVPQSEDCLYLNVLTPAEKATDKLPVMVWMHGGGFRFGSGNEPQYNLARLPGSGVVLVNVNMRLGPFGLFAHRLLSQESPQGVSGNYMFLDMIAALKWVQSNIAVFGGDPENVTIFGESGGGAKVTTLMASPLAGGLFHKAIVESGTADIATPLKDLEDMGDKFFDKLGVSNNPDPLKAARALPWEQIREVEQVLVDELHMFGPGGLWDIALDSWFLPSNPVDIFSSGQQSAVPFILLANMGELTTVPGAYLLPAYLKLLQGAAKAHVKAYVCIFDQVPSHWRREGCFCNHAMELPYVFGDWDNSSGFWTTIMELAGPAGARSPDPGLTDADRKVSEAVMQMWAQFARNGDPSVPGLISWPAWDKSTDQYLLIADPIQVRSGYSCIEHW